MKMNKDNKTSQKQKTQQHIQQNEMNIYKRKHYKKQVVRCGRREEKQQAVKCGRREENLEHKQRR